MAVLSLLFIIVCILVLNRSDGKIAQRTKSGTQTQVLEETSDNRRYEFPGGTVSNNIFQNVRKEYEKTDTNPPRREKNKKMFSVNRSKRTVQSMEMDILNELKKQNRHQEPPQVKPSVVKQKKGKELKLENATIVLDTQPAKPVKQTIVIEEPQQEIIEEVTEEAPVIVKPAPAPAVVQEQTVVEEAPKVIQSSPTVVQSPPTVVQSPPTVVQSPPSVVPAPPSVVQSPPSVVQAPPSVVQAPPSVVQAPPSVVPAPLSVVQSPPNAVQQPPTVPAPALVTPPPVPAVVHASQAVVTPTQPMVVPAPQVVPQNLQQAAQAPVAPINPVPYQPIPLRPTFIPYPTKQRNKDDDDDDDDSGDDDEEECDEDDEECDEEDDDQEYDDDDNDDEDDEGNSDNDNDDDDDDDGANGNDDNEKTPSPSKKSGRKNNNRKNQKQQKSESKHREKGTFEQIRQKSKLWQDLFATVPNPGDALTEQDTPTVEINPESKKHFMVHRKKSQNINKHQKGTRLKASINAVSKGGTIRHNHTTLATDIQKKVRKTKAMPFQSHINFIRHKNIRRKISGIRKQISGALLKLTKHSKRKKERNQKKNKRLERKIDREIDEALKELGTASRLKKLGATSRLRNKNLKHPRPHKLRKVRKPFHRLG